MEIKIELTRKQLTEILHATIGNVRDFVMSEQEWINEQLSIHGVINETYYEKKLLKGYNTLLGDQLKRPLDDASRIREMKSIINGGTIPCVTFNNWKNCIEVLNE